MMKPAITVLMTVYNAAPYLREAIESVLAQTRDDFEFVIVDDGSTDASRQIVTSIRDSRISLIENNTNKGQTACLNQGLSSARGEWIARQDADDISLPERFEKSLNAGIEFGVDLIGTQAWVINGVGKFEGILNTPLRPESMEWAALFENPFVHTTVMFKKAAADALGGYNESFQICQDFDLWARMLVADHRLANLGERLVLYRQTPQSLSQRSRDIVREEVKKVLKQLLPHVLPGTRVTDEELDMTWFFRRGLRAEELASFRKFHSQLLAKYRAFRPDKTVSRDFRRTLALQQAKISRDVAKESFSAGLAEFCRAAAIDSAFLARIVLERIVGSALIRK